MISPDWSAFAHRALAAGALYGLLPRSPSPRVLCAAAAELGGGAADVIVTIDDAALDGAAFARARAGLAANVGSRGLLAVIVASTSATGLVSGPFGARSERLGADAAESFVRAATWCASAARGPLAPAVSAERIRHIAKAAGSCGLSLVEPELAFARGLRATTRSAIDRAVLATIALGATARPLLFVPSESAPKNGLVKIREERALEGWIEGRIGERSPAPPSSLFEAALAALAESPGPVRGNALLRDARSRRGVSPSAADGPALAKDLYNAWLDGTVELYASDPSKRLLP